jgi:hypothetical protein
MKIYQILLGDVPEYLQYCVDSVIDFSNKNNILYEAITEIPSWCEELMLNQKRYCDKFYLYRSVSEWIRFDLLSSENTILIPDWDIYLNKNFSPDFGDLPIFCDHPIECMIYNGNKKDDFKKMLNSIGDRSDIKSGDIYLARGIQKYIDTNIDFKYTIFDNFQYKHLDNCRLVREHN